MAVNLGLQEQILQLEAHIQFVEAQTFMSDSRLAAASPDERSILRQEEQLLQHQLIASREHLATLQQQHMMLQPLEDQPRRVTRLHILVRCILVASAAYIAYPSVGRWKRIWCDRNEVFGVALGPYLASVLIAVSIIGTLYPIRNYLFGYQEAIEETVLQIERVLIKCPGSVGSLKKVPYYQHMSSTPHIAVQ